MGYRIDPDVLHGVAQRVAGSKTGTDECVRVIFGSPTGTQGFSGRYKHVDVHKFLLAGRIDSYDLESDETAALPPLLPGGRTCLEEDALGG
ncbi:hypothetical protein ACQI4F_10055 [Mycolicibacterium vaccae]|uniref:hypothetical protein n=1 Tax=Mycolicibacterium vaccae TaxID=1810 RepID=UPI003CEF71EE